MKILIVEDNELDYCYCSSLIKNMHPECMIYNSKSGEAAINLLKQKSIDAIIIDRKLPDIDGFELADEIRSIPRYHLLPIIFISGTDADSLEVMRHFRNYDYIVKPYNEDVFIEHLSPFFQSLSEIGKLENDEPEDQYTRRIMANGNNYRVNAKDILYAEVDNRTITLYTIHEKISRINMSLTKFIDFIAYPKFVRCSRFCVVNVDRILRMENETRKIGRISFRKSNLTCLFTVRFKQQIKNAIGK